MLTPKELTTDNTIAVVLGQRGKGKTTLAYNLVKDHSRVFVFDARWQFPTDEKDGWIHAYIVEDLPDLLKEHPEKFKICYRPRFARIDFPHICRMFQEPELGNSWFVVDEMLRVSDRYEMPPWWDDLIHFSRHNKVGIICTTQRPTDLHTDVQAGATDLFVFRQYHPRDIERIASIAPPQEAEKVKTLEIGKCLWYHEGEVLCPIDNRTLSFSKEREILPYQDETDPLEKNS